MTEKVKEALNVLRKQEYRRERIDNDDDLTSRIGSVPKEEIRLFMLEEFLKLETPYILEYDDFGFNRRNKKTLRYYLPDGKKVYGCGGNFIPDYVRILKNGLSGMRAMLDRYEAENPPENAYFYRIMRRYLELIEETAEGYRKAALEKGNTRLADALSRVPEKPAETFYEACLYLKILTYVLRCASAVHMTFGRFDQYMYPYYEHDRARGVSREELLETLELFFISLNVDGDLYIGVQQGDNGQSMVLGGVDAEGREVFNELSRLALIASRDNHMIDPKINLRVSSKTPLEIFELGSELTKEGLGFPQYSNDDVVIDGLVKKGYALADARDYAMAACWEFIIPKYGFDIANVGALSFPRVIDRVLHSGKSFETYGEFVEETKAEIMRECDEITADIKNVWFVPSPFLETLLDVKYRNLGIHGTGLATAADSLAAIETYVYNEKTVTLERLIKAVDNDFEGEAELLHALRFDAPKMGQNVESADNAACMLLRAFADALEGRVNCFGGVYRAGTGSAMFYLRHAAEIGASPDGRRKGEPFGANYSPSLFSRVSGPFSVIESFTKPCLSDAINGGPLTVEFSSTLYKGADGVHKTALFVRAFILKGGHQLQLNAVDADRMREAQANPEAHRSLIVRIWGWSAYFIELDREYQDHVIARQAYKI